MASKGSSGTGRSSKGAASAPSTKGPASSTPKSSVNSSRGAAQGAPSGGVGSANPTTGAASSGPVSRYQVYKSYGGAQNFAHSHGLRLYNDDDVQEMKAIADAYRWEEYHNP